MPYVNKSMSLEDFNVYRSLYYCLLLLTNGRLPPDCHHVVVLAFSLRAWSGGVACFSSFKNSVPHVGPSTSRRVVSACETNRLQHRCCYLPCMAVSRLARDAHMSRRRPTASRTCPYNPRRFKQWPFNQNLLNYKMILCKTPNRWSKQQMKQQCKHSRQKYWHTARAGAAKRAYRPSLLCPQMSTLITTISPLLLLPNIPLTKKSAGKHTLFIKHLLSPSPMQIISNTAEIQSLRKQKQLVLPACKESNLQYGDATVTNYYKSIMIIYTLLWSRRLVTSCLFFLLPCLISAL